jgi:drug/metabolite transporter (DMT)-like permease
METTVFLAVLAAAAFHAGWNAILKLKLEPMHAMSLIAAASGLVAVPALPLVAIPQPDSWIYLFASLVIHFVYYIALAEAYRTGDLGQVYPVARGTAPLLTAMGATVLLDEQLGLLGWIGISVLAGGIMLLSFRGGRNVRTIDRRAIGFALLTAVSIALYTLADGIGARLAGTASSYIVWMFVLDGLMMLAFGMIRFPHAMIGGIRQSWGMVIGGGALSCAAYAIAIWAMTKAPIALVAALRETSVLFAAMIGIAWLREPLIATRLVAAVLVVAGVMMVRLR